MVQMLTQYSFQADSEIINSVYSDFDNYLIDQAENDSKDKYCAVYFSSHNIYYPNSFECFNREIISKNKYEWFRTRVSYASKHIFLRDIKKQWYLTGINSKLDNPEKLFKWLKKETEGYKIITVGSSAGGFAAVLYGQLLNAERIYTFNGQFTLEHLLDTSDEVTNPVIFREAQNKYLRKYYNILKFISNPVSVYYYYSMKSKIDSSQFKHVKDIGVNIIKFNTTIHGIPFLKSALPIVLNLRNKNNLLKKSYNPLVFTAQQVGWLLMLKSLIMQLYGKYLGK